MGDNDTLRSLGYEPKKEIRGFWGPISRFRWHEGNESVALQHIVDERLSQKNLCLNLLQTKKYSFTIVRRQTTQDEFTTTRICGGTELEMSSTIKSVREELQK